MGSLALVQAMQPYLVATLSQRNMAARRQESNELFPTKLSNRQNPNKQHDRNQQLSTDARKPLRDFVTKLHL